MDIGLRVQGLGFKDHNSGFRDHDSGFWIQGLEFRVYGFGYRAEGSGVRAHFIVVILFMTAREIGSRLVSSEVITTPLNQYIV